MTIQTSSRYRLNLVRFLLAPLMAMLTSILPVSAESLTDLQKQQAALSQQAALAQQQADEQGTLAQRAAAHLATVSTQIDQVKSSIASTNGQITTTQGQIDQKTQEIALAQATYEAQVKQQNAVVREMYKARQTYQDDTVLFSDESASTRSQRQDQFDTLKKTTDALIKKTNEQKAALEKVRSDFMVSKDTLQSLSDQQTQQQRGLADIQQQQSQLKSNAEATEAALEAQANQAKAQAAQISQKIKLLSATQSWGNQIVSSDDGGWYYSQTGDYTRLGNSFYTVDEVGCYITSIAMVATFYGNKVTPDYIARSGVFSNGYLVSLPPTGITLKPSGHVDWSVVNTEIAAGRPVIVSIYLPSVGSINSDGSSHFIVIKGNSNGKYLMQDPIGHNRSYNLSQVRSMVLVRSN